MDLGDDVFLFVQEHLLFALMLLLLNFFSLCFFTERCVPEVEIRAGF